MGILAIFKKNRSINKITSLPWVPDSMKNDLARLELGQVQSIIVIASFIPTDDTHCQRLFIAAFPLLTTNIEPTLAQFDAIGHDVAGILDEIVDRRSKSALPSALAAVATSLPDGFPINESLILGQIKTRLIAGVSVDDCTEVFTHEIANDPGQYCLEKPDWLNANFQKTYVELEKSIRWNKYPGLKLDEEKCFDKFREDWDWLRTADMESKRMLGFLNDSPSDLILGFDEWRNGILDQFCKDIGEQLSKSIPEGCNLHPQNCFETAKNIISRSTFEKLPEAFQELPQRFMIAFNSDTCRYVNGLEKLFEQQAEQYFARNSPTIQEQLPLGSTLDPEMCKKGLVRLMKSNTKPEAFPQSFADMISASPLLYINFPPGSEWRAGGDSDQAMTSSPIR